jgi:fucose 4-O-acetylase-like acetyltransferase
VNIYTDNPLLLEYVQGSFINTTDYLSTYDIIKKVLKGLIFKSSAQMGGAFWFIGTLMVLSCAYCVMDFIIKNILKKDDTFKIQLFISVVFLCLGYLCSFTGHKIFGMEKVLSYYVLFFGGFALKKFNFWEKENFAIKNFTTVGHLCVLLVSFIILFVLNRFGSIALDSNSYENPLFFLIVSFAGWQLLFEISYFIKKYKVVKNIAVCTGQNTLAVVVLHFLCFKIISYAGVMIKAEPLCLIAAFPILYKGGCWWVAYTTVGLTIPVCLSLIWKNIKCLCKNKINHCAKN